MRKITVTFNSAPKIQKLKKIMKSVYNHATVDNSQLAKFNLNKAFIPAKVENIQLEINKLIGGNETVTIPKNSLTFLSADSTFGAVDSNCWVEANYIALPWNIATPAGRQELKTLINKISASTTQIKYTINVNTDEGISALDTISQAELSLSENSFEDNTEELFSRIRELEGSLRLANQNLQTANAEVTRQQNLVQQKIQEITSLNTDINNLKGQITGANSNVQYYSNLYSTNASELQKYKDQANNALGQIGTLQFQIKSLQSAVDSLNAPGTVTHLGYRHSTCNGTTTSGYNCYQYHRYTGTSYGDEQRVHLR